MAAEAVWYRTNGDCYLLLRYEDFIANPRFAIERILALLGRKDVALPIVEGNAVRLGPNHTVGGNPNRMVHGLVPLRADDQWMTEMKRRDMALVTAITAPMLRHYGYELRPTRSPV